MQHFVDLHSLTPLCQLFLKNFSTMAFCCFRLLLSGKLLFLLFQMVVQRILCNLAKPHPHIAVITELICFFQRLKKCLLGHFLSQRSIP